MGEEKSDTDTDTNSAEGDNKISSKINGNNNNNTSKETRKVAPKHKAEVESSDSNCSSSSNSSTKNSSSLKNSKAHNKSKTQVNAAGDTETEKDQNEFGLEPTKNEFKLRIVPLEKLLEKPTIKAKVEKRSNHRSEAISVSPAKKRLPARTNRRNCSIIELSDSEATDEDDIIVVANTKTTKKQTNNITQPQRTSVNNNNSSNKANETSNKSNEANNKTNDSNSKTKELSVKRCVVRLRRCAWPTKMNRTTSIATAVTVPTDERPTTTTALRRKRFKSETDSDFVMQKERQFAAVVSSDDDGDDGDTGVHKNAKQSSNSDAQSSDSEIIPARKKRIFNRGKRSASDIDSDFEPQSKPPPTATTKKRRRVKTNSSDDEDDGASVKGKKTRKGGAADDVSDDDDDDEKNKNKRKHIRKIIKTKDLDISTKTAHKEEEERRKRIEDRQKLYNQIYEKPESIEVNELVLDFDEESKEPLLEVDKGLLKKLKPHQVTGVKFMWDACFETLQDAEEKPGSGCILAHCMGLGKTLQVVTLSHTLIANTRKTHVERVLIISPLSTLNNWAREFRYWMGFARKKNIEVYDMSKYKDKPTRIFKLNEWFIDGGVCILGYDMYRILANEKAKGLRKKQREILQQALVEPGPDLVVCDEGHLLKNEKTSISKAVTRMRTKRRIVLTGTPLQNNLKEYYCMIQFIKPNLLGTYKEYLNRFVNPISNGQYTDSTERDIRLMKHRSHILHKMLEGCIQRRDYSVLAPYLPPKHEYVLYTTLSKLQQQLYEFYMNVQRDVIGTDLSGKGARLFQDFQDLRRIWTHPMSLRVNSDTVIRKRVLANDSDSMEDFICDDDDDDDDDDGPVHYSSSDNSIDSSKSFASGGKLAVKVGGKMRKTRNNKNVNGGDGNSDVEEVPLAERDDPSEWWKRFVDEKELNNINHSPKLLLLMKLLQQCEAIGDKLLVFSQSLQSLEVIEHFLSLINSNTKGYEFEGDVGNLKGFWTPGKDYFRLDGSCSVENREAMCKQFNDTTNLRARLFLISTRAGGLGINLVAANRVVIFDVSWNPSHDTQSIFRVYRFGQEKPCYIYRLIAMGTMEQKVYERQVAKQATAKRVIDEQQISRHYNQSDLQELYTYELKPSAEREIPNLPKDRMFAEMLREHETLLFKYHEHDSLLENEESENLSEDERKAAWSEYEAEKTRSVQTAQYMSYDRNAFGNAVGGQFGNAAGSVTSNKIFGIRSDVLLQLLNMKVLKDNPEFSQNQVIQMVPSYLQRLYNEMNNDDPTMYMDLLELHRSLTQPSGMYMNPLLYANQNPAAAGYFQASTAGAAATATTGVVVDAAGETQQITNAGTTVPPPAAAPGFDPDQVYEID